jgi:nicotinamidase/pyrazinamidase
MADKRRQVVLLVHVQADFTQLRGGTLAVPGTGKEYLERVIAQTREFQQAGLPVVATRDWHPADHVSFASSHPGAKPFEAIRIGEREQVLWPDHCVQDTPGAEILVPADVIATIVSSGYEREYESYSGFSSDGGTDTGLRGALEGLRAEELIVYGLATDYCVQATVMDALELGYAVIVELGLCRGITEEGVHSSVNRMATAGARIQP